MYQPRQVHTRAFCDSKIVLAWLQGHPPKWKTYIANRTSQILEWMEPSQWNYIDTKLNPADCASRGLLPRELLCHPLWLNGPNLEELQYTGVGQLDSDQDKIVNEMVKKNSLILHIKKCEPFPLLTAFSRHSKLVKRVSTITEFIKRILRKLILKPVGSVEKYKNILSNLETSGTVVFECYKIIVTVKKSLTYIVKLN